MAMCGLTFRKLCWHWLGRFSLSVHNRLRKQHDHIWTHLVKDPGWTVPLLLRKNGIRKQLSRLAAFLAAKLFSHSGGAVDGRVTNV